MTVLPDLASLGIFAAAALLLLLTPGPAVLYIVARSLEQGRRAGLVSALGVHLGTLVHVAAAGLSAILAASATAFSVVKYLGAAYLVYLGARSLLERRTAGNGADRPRPLRRAFLDGVVVNVLNPKTALFFLAFLPQFVNVSRDSVGAQVLALGVLFVLLGLVTDGGYALMAGTAAQWLRGRPLPGRRALALRRDVHRTRHRCRLLEQPPQVAPRRGRADQPFRRGRNSRRARVARPDHRRRSGIWRMPAAT
jgi:threonine/homoserine/homoserine lactone efflux protein